MIRKFIENESRSKKKRKRKLFKFNSIQTDNRKKIKKELFNLTGGTRLRLRPPRWVGKAVKGGGGRAGGDGDGNALYCPPLKPIPRFN